MIKHTWTILNCFRYVHEYDCTQYLLFDCCNLVKIEFEATGDEIRTTDQINIEIAFDTRYEQKVHLDKVLGRGEEYATVRGVIYSSILAGTVSVGLFANVQPATISPPDGSNYVYLSWSESQSSRSSPLHLTSREASSSVPKARSIFDSPVLHLCVEVPGSVCSLRLCLSIIASRG